MDIYTQSALVERIKHELATIKIDEKEYRQEINSQRGKKAVEQYFYDYDLDLDFSSEPKILDDRKYYYRFWHYQRITVLKPVPHIKVSLWDLSLESIQAFLLLVPEEREYILKQAVGKIFEDINSKMYHDSISSLLKVKFIDGSNYDFIYTINEDSKENNTNENYFKEKQGLINQILQEQEEYFEEKFQTNKNLDENDVADNNNKNSNNNDDNKDIDLLELIKERCIELFVDQYNIPHVTIIINKHSETLSLNSKKLKNIFFKICYDKTGKVSTEKIENMINILQAEAGTSDNIRYLDLRVGKIDYGENCIFYYDLTDSKWRVVEITSQGWSIIEKDMPVIFKRYSNQLPQIVPATADTDATFDKFMGLLNIQDEDTRLLLKCYIISLFIPGIAKPILMIYGEQGSAKTTFQELIRMLVDPSSLKTLSFPRDVNGLIQILAHNYVTYFDNISHIPDWISNLLCRAVTGSAFSKRQLYTDDDDVIYNFKRCLGFNGINLGATKADLLDRGIIIPLERIPKEKRKKVAEIWDEFDNIKSQLLGYIFEILVKVLRFKKETKIEFPDGYNRMADFEEYSEIISRCMGYPENEFLRVYQDNIDIQIDEAIEASPLSTAIRTFMLKEREWEGTATQLLDELNCIAQDDLKISITNNSFWVKTANHLSRRINEIKTNLREKGIIIERLKDKDGKKIKISIISSTSSYRQETENHAQDQDIILGDTNNDTDYISSQENITDQAYNNNTERYDDKVDGLHIKVSEHLANGKTLKCYRCKDIEYHSLETYNRHYFSKHPKEPMYPELSLIKMMGLEPIGNPWEV